MLKRYSMIGDGLSCGLRRLAVSTALGFAPLAVAVPVVIIAAFFLLRLSNSAKLKGDAAIALISTASLAIGVLAVSLSGTNADLNSYLFGSIIAVSKPDMYLSVALSVIVGRYMLCCITGFLSNVRRGIHHSDRCQHGRLQYAYRNFNRYNGSAGNACNGRLAYIESYNIPA